MPSRSRAAAVLERRDELVVLAVRIKVPRFFGFRLGSEAFCLIHRINEFRVRVDDLPAADDELEAVRDFRILVVPPRQRR